MKYKARWTDRKDEHDGFAYDSIGPAIAEANLHLQGSKTVVVLRDSEGADHPDNQGKFFLTQILK